MSLSTWWLFVTATFLISAAPGPNMLLIIVKNTFNPDHEGTLICNESGKDIGYINGISSLKNISLINIEGSGMI